MSQTEPPRVALVTNVLAHYRVLCFKHLAEQLDQRLTVYLLAGDMEHRRYVMARESSDLPLVHLPGWRWRRPPGDDRHFNDVRPVLRANWQALILGAWDEPTNLLLWAWAAARRRKIIFWIESTAVDLPRNRAKEAVKRLLLRQAATCMVPGQRAAEYCRQLGVDEQRIFQAPNATDRCYFQARAEHLRPRRTELRQAARLRNLAILFVGRMVERYKGIETLLKACAELEQRGLPPTLLLAGGGPDETHYRHLAARLGLGDVRFLGTLAHDELCRYYTMADVFVLPSRSEPWGFVLNEGMEFGLPLVVSDRVGAGPDLVRSENGLTFPVGDIGALGTALERLGRDEELRQRMGESSRRIVADFSPQRWAAGAMRAIGAACAS